MFLHCVCCITCNLLILQDTNAESSEKYLILGSTIHGPAPVCEQQPVITRYGNIETTYTFQPQGIPQIVNSPRPETGPFDSQTQPLHSNIQIISPYPPSYEEALQRV